MEFQFFKIKSGTPTFESQDPIAEPIKMLAEAMMNKNKSLDKPNINNLALTKPDRNILALTKQNQNIRPWM